MELREFSKVFDGLPHWLDEDKAMSLERQFIDDGTFSWNMSFRKAGLFHQFVEEITSFDLGLKEGQVVKYLSSLGCRLIFIGTFAGNVIIHQRNSFGEVEHDGQPENAPVVAVCYAPDIIEPLVGNKPLRQNDLYRLTGYFNSRDNLGNALSRIRHRSSVEVA